MFFLCLGFRASYFNIYKENQLDAVQQYVYWQLQYCNFSVANKHTAARLHQVGFLYIYSKCSIADLF